MTNVRIWGIVCGAAILAALVGGWFVGVQPQLAAAAQTDLSTAEMVARNQQTAIRISQLAKAAAKIDAMKAQDAVLQKAVPSLLKPNRFIRRINETAALDGAIVKSVTIGDAVPYTAPAGEATGTTPALKLAKTSPLVSGSALTVVPVVVTISATPSVVLQFIRDTQSGERAFAVSGLETTTDDTSGLVTATITGSIYTLKR